MISLKECARGPHVPSRRPHRASECAIRASKRHEGARIAQASLFDAGEEGEISDARIAQASLLDAWRGGEEGGISDARIAQRAF